MSDPIVQIRRFNREITRRAGVLSGSFLGCGLSLGQARLLFEIGAGVTEVRRQREKLGLDSGYLSRLLRSLEKKGWVETSADERDARARIARLTPAGLEKLGELETLSDEGARAWLAPLSPKKRARLVAAMAEVEHLLQASEITVRTEDPRSEAALWCLEQYFQELSARFESEIDLEFDPGLTLPASPEQMTPPHGYFLLAALPDRPVGCGALKVDDEVTAQVKRMWVSQDVRGLGVGRRLLDSLEALAREHGLRRLRLETNKTLAEAQALYKSAGFEEIEAFNDEPYAHFWFEKRLG